MTMLDDSNILVTWFRREPFTVSVLTGTLIVNLIVALMSGNYLPGPAPIPFGLAASQLSLLAWWTATASRFRSLRALTLIIIAGEGAFVFGDRNEGAFNSIAFAYFILHSAVVAVSAWIGLRIVGSRISPNQKIQFSMRQLLLAMTGCAVVAMLSRYAKFSEVFPDSESVVFLGSTTLFGVVGPGCVLLNRWPLRVRWILPLLFGAALTLAASDSIGIGSPFFWIVNGTAGIVYSLWGLAIGIDAQRRQRDVIDDQTPE